MSIEANKELVKNFLAAMQGPNRADLARMLTADARWVLPRSAPELIRGSHDGREAILDLLVSAAANMLVPGYVFVFRIAGDAIAEFTELPDTLHAASFFGN